VGLVVLLVVLGLAGRYLLLPVLSGNTSAPSAAEAHLSDLQTQEALAPQPTLAPTSLPTVVPVAVVRPTLVPTAKSTVVPPTATVAPAAQSTITPELISEISQAYLTYFQVRADALQNLDASHLDDVAAGDALAGLQQEIDQDRAAGRAIRTDVVHNYSVVSATDDAAEVADDYRDSSVFVDPATKEPLAGEVVPATPQDAPEVKVVYDLHRISGVWKVTGGRKYV
jgi:hypothetical protein